MVLLVTNTTDLPWRATSDFQAVIKYVSSTTSQLKFDPSRFLVKHLLDHLRNKHFI